MKKKILSVVLTAALASALLAGCGGSSSSTATTAAPAETTAAATEAAPAATEAAPAETEAETEAASGSADQIIVLRANESKNLDPVLITENADTQIARQIYEALYKWNETGDENVLDTAESVETSEDGLTWTFKIRDDLYFCNGDKATAQDWKWSLERAKNTEANQFRSNFDAIASIEAPDDTTLIITLSEPSVAFPATLTGDTAYLASQKYYEEVGEEEFGKKPVTSGILYVKDWVAGQYITLAPNPYHRDADKVQFKELKIETVADENTRTMRLMNGEADIVLDCTPTQFAILEAADGVKAMQSPAMQARYLMFNCTKTPTDNKTVREALRYATNLDEIVAVASNGLATPANSFFCYGEFGFNYDLPVPQQDLEKAKELLAEAGYPDGFDIDFWVRADNPEYDAIATTIKEQWAKIGVNVNLTTMETAAILDAQYNVDQPIVIGRWSEGMNDPQGIAQYFFSYDDTFCYFTGLHLDEGLEILKKASVESDTEARAQMYRDVQQIFYDEVPGIPLYYPDWFFATSDKIDGLYIVPEGQYFYQNVVKSN